MTAIGSIASLTTLQRVVYCRCRRAGSAMTLPLSVLDLVPVGAGSGAAAALRRTLDLAGLADRLGYVRYWFAEHHGMPSVACSSPEVLIAHVAASTVRLRVGSGGVMLPNHPPLRVAEAFRTLAALHPDRIDLGLGRAPGSDATASRALRAYDGEHFPALLSELLTWSGESDWPDEVAPDHPLRSLRAMPDDAPLPPIWLLGSAAPARAWPAPPAWAIPSPAISAPRRRRWRRRLPAGLVLVGTLRAAARHPWCGRRPRATADQAGVAGLGDGSRLGATSGAASMRRCRRPSRLRRIATARPSAGWCCSSGS